MSSGVCSMLFDSEMKVHEAGIHPKCLPIMKSDFSKEVYLVAACLDCLQEIAYVKWKIETGKIWPRGVRKIN